MTKYEQEKLEFEQYRQEFLRRRNTPNNAPSPKEEVIEVPENIPEKIRKLLMLASSPNAAEAKSAWDMANKLIKKYNLSMVDFLQNS